MMKDKRLIGISSIVLIMVLVGTSLMVARQATAGSPPIPAVVKIGVHEVGTAGHLLGSIAAEAMIGKYGNKVRAVPAGAEMARSMMARTGTVDAVLQAGATVFLMAEGIFGYDELEWGPQPIQGIFLAAHVGLVLAVRGDSKIYTYADLKGKRVPTFPPSPPSTWLLDGLLWFGGLTRADVVSVEYTSAGKAYEAVIEGKLDVTYWNVAAPKTYELAAMPWGIRYLPMPAADKEGWARIVSKYPIWAPRTAVTGAGITKDKPLECGTYASPYWFVWPHVSEDVTYFLAKALHECYPIYAPKSEEMKEQWTIDLHWKQWDGAAGMIPLHPGAVRYYKEVGMWTPEREKLQQERLKKQAELKKLWDATVAEAAAKGIKGVDFPKFWVEKKKAAGFYVP